MLPLNSYMLTLTSHMLTLAGYVLILTWHGHLTRVCTIRSAFALVSDVGILLEDGTNTEEPWTELAPHTKPPCQQTPFMFQTFLNKT